MTQQNVEKAHPIGGVVRSLLDDRCWFATIDNVDIETGEANCSTSVQRVKRYVRETACRLGDVDPADTVWVRESDRVWNLYARADLSSTPVQPNGGDH